MVALVVVVVVVATTDLVVVVERHSVRTLVFIRRTFPVLSQVKFNHQLCGQNGRMAM